MSESSRCEHCGQDRAAWDRLLARAEAAEAERDRLAGLVDCDLDATTRYANALEDENERLRRRFIEQSHTLSAESRNVLQDRLADVRAERDALAATLRAVETALCADDQAVMKVAYAQQIIIDGRAAAVSPVPPETEAT